MHDEAKKKFINCFNELLEDIDWDYDPKEEKFTVGNGENSVLILLSDKEKYLKINGQNFNLKNSDIQDTEEILEILEKEKVMDNCKVEAYYFPVCCLACVDVKYNDPEIQAMEDNGVEYLFDGADNSVNECAVISEFLYSFLKKKFPNENIDYIDLFFLESDEEIIDEVAKKFDINDIKNELQDKLTEWRSRMGFKLVPNLENFKENLGVDIDGVELGGDCEPDEVGCYQLGIPVVVNMFGYNISMLSSVYYGSPT